MAVAPKSGHWFCATTSRTTSSLSLPASIPTLIPSMTMIALSVSMHSAMMSAPSEMRSISRSPFMYMTKNVAMIVRNSTMPIMKPGLAAHREQQHHEDDGDRLAQVEHELVGGLGDRFGLEVDLADLDADRLVAFELLELLPDAFPIVTTLPPWHRGDSQADGRLAVVAEQTPRRILVAALQRGDVPEKELAARLVRADHQIEHVVGRAEAARRIERDVLIVADAHAAAVGGDVPRLELAVDLLLVDAELRQPLPRDFEEDDFLLFAEELDALDARHQEQLAAQELDVAAQLRGTNSHRR